MSQKSWRRTQAVAIAMWGLIGVGLVVANPVIQNSDLFGFIERARRISFAQPDSLVSGFYPLGYPALLRVLVVLVPDYGVASQIVSLASGVLALCAVAALGRRIHPQVGLLALLLCATNGTVLRLSTSGGTDMPSAALLCAALAAAHSRRRAGYFGCGALLGAAYLIRYTALTVVPCVAVWIYLQSMLARRPYPLRDALSALGGFLVVASPQLVASAALRGNPFFNLQAQNVHFGLSGATSWGLEFGASAQVTSLFDVVRGNPLGFARHWYYTSLGALRTLLDEPPIGALACAGALIGLKERRSRATMALICTSITAFTLAISMAFVNHRLLVVVTMLSAVLAATALVRLTPLAFSVASWRAPSRWILLSVLLAWSFWEHVVPVLRHPLSGGDEKRLAVAVQVRSAGASRASEVLALGFEYYDVAAFTKDRYAIPWYEPGAPPYTSEADIADRMRRGGQTILVFDDDSPKNVPGLGGFWSNTAERWTPYFDLVGQAQDARVYRLRAQ